jgi:oligosaccharide repeat unit polymerase wzy
MKITLEKSSLKNFLFYFAYSIYLGYNLLDTSFYSKNINVFGNLLIIIVLVMLIFKEVIDFKVNSRDLTLFIILAIIGGLFFNYMGYNYAMLPFFVYSARNVNTTTIVKISYRISLVLLIFIIVSSYLGWITNYITYDGGREREYVGFRYSLFGPAILCNIIFLKVYLEKDNIKWRTLMFLIIGNYALYEFTDSRLTFGLGMLLLILTILIKLFSKFKRVLMNKILIGSYVVSGLLSLYFTIGYNHLSEWHSNINEFLGGRLSLGYSTLKYYGYGLLGKRITLVGNGLDVDGYITTETYDYVDNLYIQLLLKLGLLFLVIFILGMTIVMWRVYRLNDIYLYIIFSLLALHGIIDDLMILPQYNSFWFVIAALFYKTRLDLQNE